MELHEVEYIQEHGFEIAIKLQHCPTILIILPLSAPDEDTKLKITLRI
jgi:hypothetical protein